MNVLIQLETLIIFIYIFIIYLPTNSKMGWLSYKVYTEDCEDFKYNYWQATVVDT